MELRSIPGGKQPERLEGLMKLRANDNDGFLEDTFKLATSFPTESITKPNIQSRKSSVKTNSYPSGIIPSQFNNPLFQWSYNYY